MDYTHCPLRPTEPANLRASTPFLFFVLNRLGDLLCCETCSAVYHLGCVDPPLAEVPEEDWHCSICVAHMVNIQYFKVIRGGKFAVTKSSQDQGNGNPADSNPNLMLNCLTLIIVHQNFKPPFQ